VAAIDLLLAARELGMRVKLADEGGHWPRGLLPGLRERIDRTNGAVAALAGALKDAADETGGPTVPSPIFARPHFERIEAEGAAANAEHLRATVKTVLGAGVAPPRAE